jgi:hypothetical protein
MLEDFQANGNNRSWVPVAHTCNPNYSEDEIRKITVQGWARQINLETLSRKYQTQKGLVEWLKWESTCL